MIEHLRRRDLCRGRADVRCLIDDDHDIACADADRRRAARISRANSGLRAGGNDQIDLTHQFAGGFAVDGRRQLLHQIARRGDAVQLGGDVLEQQRSRRLSFG